MLFLSQDIYDYHYELVKKHLVSVSQEESDEDLSVEYKGEVLSALSGAAPASVELLTLNRGSEVSDFSNPYDAPLASPKASGIVSEKESDSLTALVGQGDVSLLDLEDQ